VPSRSETSSVRRRTPGRTIGARYHDQEGPGNGWSTGTAPSRVGEILELREEDYRYGVGVLILRISYIDLTSFELYDGDWWHRVEGTQLGRDGREIEFRRVSVRARALGL